MDPKSITIFNKKKYQKVKLKNFECHVWTPMCHTFENSVFKILTCKISYLK